MHEIDWLDVFGVGPEDRKRWEEMEAVAQKRIEREGGIAPFIKEAADSGLNLAQQAAEAKTQAAQSARRDDARATRPRRRVVEERIEFLDDDPEFG